MPSIIHNKALESHVVFVRAVVSAVLVFLMFGGIVARLIHLQIIHHEHFTTLSHDNRVRLEPLPPARGLIFDHKDKILADNIPTFSMEITPEKADDIAGTIEALGHIVHIGEEDRRRFEKLRQQHRRFQGIPIRLQLNEEEVARFALNQYRFPGVDVRANLLRSYPLAALTAHALGYVGRISEQDLDQLDRNQAAGQSHNDRAAYAATTHMGKTGLEKYYESTLHGRVGVQQVEVNAKGRALRVLDSQSPTPGRNLHLFLDVELQRVAETALEHFTGAVVAIDPKTGGVLALVSRPSYNANLFVEGISGREFRRLNESDDKPLLNRAIRGQYPPGSTIKPFVALAGLETRTIGFRDRKFCPGHYQLPGQSHRYRDWRKSGHGTVDMDTAIFQSCDVYFYDLARALGVDQLQRFLSRFGFGHRSGIDLTGELSGLMPSQEWKQKRYHQPWYAGETIIMGIGQGYVLTSPLQLASAVATLANHGRSFRPRLVRAIGAPNGASPIPLPPDVTLLPIWDDRHWDQVIEGMTHVVSLEKGTAHRIHTDAYQIAGKTGTAQVYSLGQKESYDENKIPERLRDHALFVAFAPVEDPRIAVAVIIEHGGHGGSVAAPVARAVMDQYLLRLDN